MLVQLEMRIEKMRTINRVISYSIDLDVSRTRAMYFTPSLVKTLIHIALTTTVQLVSVTHLMTCVLYCHVTVMADMDESRDPDAAKRAEAEAMLSSPSAERHTSSVPELNMAPDGGWGWVVVICSFFISVIVDGIGYSFGIVKGDLDNHFQTASSTSAWAGSLLNGVYLSVGECM